MDHVRIDLRQSAIDHHIQAAHSAASLASSMVSEAGSSRPDDVTPEMWLARQQLMIATAAAAAQTADAHTRLLELKLAIGDTAL